MFTSITGRDASYLARVGFADRLRRSAEWCQGAFTE
jgi:hypothetical protein